MRQNTQKAFNAWNAGKNYRAPGRNGSPIWTDGRTIFSYSKPILARQENGPARLNSIKYSVTTSQQQNGLRSLLAMHGINYTELDCEQI